jgi:drug/metabolite transporter (DMT)-like permease
MRHPVRSAIDLFGSRWWSIGWGVAAVAFALHVAALTLAPLSIGQAVLAGGLVFLAVLAERFFGFELGRRQWIGIGLVAVSLTLLTLTGGGGGGGAHADYSLAGMIIFEGISTGRGPTKAKGIISSALGTVTLAGHAVMQDGARAHDAFAVAGGGEAFLGCREAVAKPPRSSKSSRTGRSGPTSRHRRTSETPGLKGCRWGMWRG